MIDDGVEIKKQAVGSGGHLAAISALKLLLQLTGCFSMAFQSAAELMKAFNNAS